MLSSKLPEIDGVVKEKHPLVCKLLDAVYNERIHTAKQSVSWDAETVLEKLKDMDPNASLSLKQLTLKTVFSLDLTSFGHVSELVSIEYRTLRFEDGGLRLSLLKPEKIRDFWVTCIISV